MKNLVLVTGSTSGIGKDIALHLRNKGFGVIVHGSNAEKLSEFRNVDGLYQWQFNLINHKNLSIALSEFISKNNIVINHFVHCAGIDQMAPIRSLNSDLYHDVFSINFFSAVEIVKTLVSKKNNSSSLKSCVMISSNASGFGAKGMSMYVASKSALDGFMKSAAVECAPSVRFNSVLPGAVQTEMTKSTFNDPEISSRLLSAYPMGAGQPSNISAAVEFLLSDSASWINGQQLVVDGGRAVNISA